MRNRLRDMSKEERSKNIREISSKICDKYDKVFRELAKEGKEDAK